jgi:hypothetical protein
MPYKSDCYSAYSSDHFIHAGSDLCIYLALLFSNVTVHGSVPDDFLKNTIILIQKTSMLLGPYLTEVINEALFLYSIHGKLLLI